MRLLVNYKKEILIAISIVSLYFVSRLFLLGNFPIFTDEAIYVRWTQIAAHDASWRFISLTDGKQPLFVWIAMPFLKFISDPLTAVRLVSVLSGFFTLIGLCLLSYELFKNRMVALLASLLYVIFPFAIVYDRMALYDSMVGAFAVWAIYLSILFVRRIRLDIAYTLGAVIGGGMLTKSNANFSMLLLPFTLILFNFKQKKWKINLIKWGLFAFIAVSIAEVLYNSLRLSPYFHIIKEKNTTFIYYPFSIPIDQNLQVFFGNLKGLSDWLFTYLTPFYTFLILFSFVSKRFIKEKILLVLYFIIPFVTLAFFGKVIFPRFIFFMSVYLLPLGALGLFNFISWVDNFMKERKINTPHVVSALVIVLFILYPLKISLDFIFNPSIAKIADADQRQYITEWPAGGGVRESIMYFENQAKNRKIFVGTEGTFGLMPAGLDIYLGNNPNIKTKGYWPIEDKMPLELSDMASVMPTYFIFYQPCPSCKFSGDAPDTWPLTLVKKVKKGENVYYSVYRAGQ